MNFQIVMGLGASVVLIWGTVIAIWSRWAASLMRNGSTDTTMTPATVRVIGIILIVIGTMGVILASIGAVPDVN